MIKSIIINLKEQIIKILNKLEQSKHFEIIGVFIYKIILDFAFIIFIQQYVIEPYKTDFNIYKYILGYIIMFVLLNIINKIKTDFNRFFIKIFYLLMFIPITTVYGAKNYSTISYILFFIEFLLIVITIVLMERLFKGNKGKKEQKEKKEKFLKITSKIIYYGFLLNTLIVIIACIYYNGLPTLKAFNLQEVYEVRENFYLPKYINYLYTFEIKFILNFLLVLYMHKKNYIKFGLVILIQIFLYLCKGDRIVLLSMILTISVYFIFRLYKRYKIDKYVAPLIGGMILITIICYPIFNMLYSILVNRLLILPSMLKFIYLDFFAQNPKIGIVGTLLNAILKLDSPYADIAYPNLVGEIYFNRPEMYANTGFLAEGFARFGYIGVILLPIILGIIVYSIGRATKKHGISFMAAIATLPLLNLNDSFLLPSLTFGAILLLIIVSIFFDSTYIKIKPTNLAHFKLLTKNNEGKEEKNEKV